jgi:hypothetical protein
VKRILSKEERKLFGSSSIFVEESEGFQHASAKLA